MKKHNFAVIFDMDGVIVNNNLYHKKAWKLFCKRHNLNISQKELNLNIYGKLNSNILMHLFGKKLANKQIFKYAEEKEGIYRNIYKKYIALTKGLANFLKLLDDYGIKCAIATSAPQKNIQLILTKTGIKKYFKTIIDASQVSRGKPHPEIYLKTAKEMNFNPSKCIVFEDSISGIKKYFKTIVDASQVSRGKPHPEIYLKTAKEMNFNPSKCIVFEDSISGIKAAKTAGMKVIALSTTHSKKELKADLTIRDFTQINIKALDSISKSYKAPLGSEAKWKP